MLKPRLVGAAVAGAALAGGSAASAVAADRPATFGQDVSMCAQSLGQRTSPPSVTCSHDGTAMTFANLGEMVLHMKAHHG